MTRDHQRVTECLLAENAVLREHLRGSRIRYKDAQRRRLAAAAKRLGRKTLRQLDTLVTPDTLMRPYRRLVAKLISNMNSGREKGVTVETVFRGDRLPVIGRRASLPTTKASVLRAADSTPWDPQAIGDGLQFKFSVVLHPVADRPDRRRLPRLRAPWTELSTWKAQIKMPCKDRIFDVGLTCFRIFGPLNRRCPRNYGPN